MASINDSIVIVTDIPKLSDCRGGGEVDQYSQLIELMGAVIFSILLSIVLAAYHHVRRRHGDRHDRLAARQEEEDAVVELHV